MKPIFALLFTTFSLVNNLKAQDLREEIILRGNTFKVFDVSTNDAKTETTKYQVLDNQGNKIEHIARVFDKNKDNETFLGVYRKNDNAIHFIEFNQTKNPNTLNHFVYSPDNKGKLILVKKEFDLKDFPKDLPPKFKNNQPIHPEFPGGDDKLNEWTQKNIAPILKKMNSSQEYILTISIDDNGAATLQNLHLLQLDKETEKKLVSKIVEMPKWNTLVQGYKVTGLVFVPISL